MKTVSVCEHLLHNIPSLREVFIKLNIIVPKRQIQPKYHEELKNTLSEFNDSLVIICIVGLIQEILLIEPIKVSRKFPMVKIVGFESEKIFLSKSGLATEISSILNIKDFLPLPLVRKMIYIKNYKTMDGMVFSEYLPNIWTIDDPLIIPPKKYKKITVKEIISEIVGDVDEIK